MWAVELLQRCALLFGEDFVREKLGDLLAIIYYMVYRPTSDWSRLEQGNPIIGQ